VRRFAASKIAPDFHRWEDAGIVERSLWMPAARPACFAAGSRRIGGAGGDFRHNAIVIEELSYSGFAGPATDFSVHNDVCCGYLLSYGSPEQKKTWLPRMVSGETVCAIAMTEPGTGSDLQGIRTRAVREGDDYVISGQKTFISNGQMCDLVIVVVRTAPEGGTRGMSLVLVETDRPGFRRGKNLEKLGHLSSDTSELFFNEVRVPVSNLLGAEGGAMGGLMSELPQERLTIALHSIAAAQKAFDLTKDYVRQRNALDRRLVVFKIHGQTGRSEVRSRGRLGLRRSCLHEHINHELTTYSASTAKLWITEMHGRVVDECLQFFGGYGFMREYEICRLYADARVLRIYGGLRRSCVS